jgi:hypothetical protein
MGAGLEKGPAGGSSRTLICWSGEEHIKREYLQAIAGLLNSPAVVSLKTDKARLVLSKFVRLSLCLSHRSRISNGQEPIEVETDRHQDCLSWNSKRAVVRQKDIREGQKRKSADPVHDNYLPDPPARLSNRKNRAPVLKGKENLAHSQMVASGF